MIRRQRISRRKVVLGAAGAGAAAVALSLPGVSTTVSRHTRGVVRGTPLLGRLVTLDYAGVEEWNEMVGSTFAAAGGYRLSLAGVQPFESRGARPWSVARDRGFLAVFEVAGGVAMPTDLIYTLAHPDRGQVPLFLSASTDPRTPGRMLAVIN